MHTTRQNKKFWTEPKEKQVGYQQNPDNPVTWAKFYDFYSAVCFVGVYKYAPWPAWWYGYDNTKCTEDFKY